MSAATDKPTDRPPQGDSPDDRQGERFRATARRIAVQLDIEETMWRMLDRTDDQDADGLPLG